MDWSVACPECGRRSQIIPIANIGKYTHDWHWNDYHSRLNNLSTIISSQSFTIIITFWFRRSSRGWLEKGCR